MLKRKSVFKARLLRPMQQGNEPSWAFVLLPGDASKKLSRRGRTTVAGTINGHHFVATLDPDGKRSHWLRVEQEQLRAAGVTVGEVVVLEIEPLAKEPEPEVPADLENALASSSAARRVWGDTTTIARLDWIHWITSAKQSKTRAKRINDACEMLASGKRRVCCFDPSDFFSKALNAPEVAE